jgi:DNA repair protein RadC
VKPITQLFLRSTTNLEGVTWDHHKEVATADLKALAARFMRHESVEVFGMFHLNHHNHLLGYTEIARGSTHKVISEPREIAKAALLTNAYGVVLMHNHPNEPLVEVSKEDVLATAAIVEALSLFRITVVDHMVVGGEDVESLMVAPNHTTAALVRQILRPQPNGLDELLKLLGGKL